MDFPIFKTKIGGKGDETRVSSSRFASLRSARVFNLTLPEEQREYFELKAGEEIKKIRRYLEKSSFVAYLLGKKNSGKGTYAKMFASLVNPEKITHFSIGDMIRGIDGELKDGGRKRELVSFLEKNYRGSLPLETILASLENRSTKVLLPTELILTLVKREIEKKEKKAIFIDGFPRDMDQINFSLFFRDLIGYRDDPDVFVLIDVPEAVIDERIKWRRVCPRCQTSRNLKLLPTSLVEFDEAKKEFYLVCDNPECQKVRMERKEGDEAGIDPIRERLKMDGVLMEKALNLHGIPKIFLRNSIPVSQAKELVDDYEITPEYVFEKSGGKVKTIEKPWIIPDDQGKDSYSLLAQPVVLALLKQMASTLGL